LYSNYSSAESQKVATYVSLFFKTIITSKQQMEQRYKHFLNPLTSPKQDFNSKSGGNIFYKVGVYIKQRFLIKPRIFLSIILSVIGLAFWIVVSKMSNKTEALDSFYYYTIGLPIMFGVSAIAGFLEPKYPPRWGHFSRYSSAAVLFITSENAL
jgi:hypothetical protein